VLPCDAIAIRNQATTINPIGGQVTSVTDSGYLNIANGYGGLGVVNGVGVEIGNLIRVIAGTGRGQPPSLITANSSTSLTFQPPLTMDETSIWIIEGPVWQFQVDSTAIGNASPTASTALIVPTENYIDQPILVSGFTVDINGNESPDGDNPIREDWIYGAAGAPQPVMTVQVNTATTLAPEAQICEADATNGSFAVTLPPFSEWLGQDIALVKVDGTANAVTWQTSGVNDVVVGYGASGTLTVQGQMIRITATQA
jgi:hypothetical protein